MAYQVRVDKKHTSSKPARILTDYRTHPRLLMSTLKYWLVSLVATQSFSALRFSLFISVRVCVPVYIYVFFAPSWLQRAICEKGECREETTWAPAGQSRRAHSIFCWKKKSWAHTHTETASFLHTRTKEGKGRERERETPLFLALNVI